MKTSNIEKLLSDMVLDLELRRKVMRSFASVANEYHLTSEESAAVASQLDVPSLHKDSARTLGLQTYNESKPFLPDVVDNSTVGKGALKLVNQNDYYVRPVTVVTTTTTTNTVTVTTTTTTRKAQSGESDVAKLPSRAEVDNLTQQILASTLQDRPQLVRRLVDIASVR